MSIHTPTKSGENPRLEFLSAEDFSESVEDFNSLASLLGDACRRYIEGMDKRSTYLEYLADGKKTPRQALVEGVIGEFVQTNPALYGYIEDKTLAEMSVDSFEALLQNRVTWFMEKGPNIVPEKTKETRGQVGEVIKW